MVMSVFIQSKALQYRIKSYEQAPSDHSESRGNHETRAATTRH